APEPVVELLDDLERPAPVQDVNPHHLLTDARGELGPAGIVQLVGGLLEEDVRPADQLVQVVQVSAGALDVLHRLADGPGRLDLGVGRAVGSAMRPVDARGPVAGSRACHAQTVRVRRRSWSGSVWCLSAVTRPERGPTASS